MGKHTQNSTLFLSIESFRGRNYHTRICHVNARINVMNPRELLLDQLERYAVLHPDETETASRFADFVRSHGDAFLRSCAPGHVTGSAFIVDPSMALTLVVHHRKLDKWLQPGGHCDPGETSLEAALREALEETGVTASPADAATMFDIDIHPIPARAAKSGDAAGGTPAHLHYDARWLLLASPGTTSVSDESHAVEWVSLDEAVRRNPEESIARMVRKVRKLTW
jgi:8-oxo-dGTP pyrophosphatase MutT (NUDIX family)